jgi:hypothetical protein
MYRFDLHYITAYRKSAMNCPTGNDCDIKFVSETMDRGDGVYFESYIVFFYDDTDSVHAPECPGLTDEQIEQMEDEYNASAPDYEPFL